MATDDKKLDQRIAALEKGLREAESRAEKAEAKNAALDRDKKRLEAQHKEMLQQAKGEISRLNTMRGLTGEVGYDDPKAKYEELKAATVKTKDGRRHYFSKYACYLGDNGKPPYTYHPAESFVSLPEDQDPSVTFEPVEVAGKDPQTGRPIFVVKGSLAKAGAAAEVDDPANQVDGEGLTNTAINDRRAAQAAAAAQMGPGSTPRPSDQNVG